MGRLIGGPRIRTNTIAAPEQAPTSASIKGRHEGIVDVLRATAVIRRRCYAPRNYLVMTATIFLSDGFTIKSWPSIIAKSQGRSAGISLAALAVTGWSLTLLDTTLPMALKKLGGAFCFLASLLRSFQAVFCWSAARLSESFAGGDIFAPCGWVPVADAAKVPPNSMAAANATDNCFIMVISFLERAS
jgi:hypothetical protein